jgi:hypothetical protein
MAVIEDGVSSALLAKVLANLAIATREVPLSGGAFSAGFETTSLAFTNNVVVWDFRNPGANLILVGQVNARICPMATAAPALTGLRASLQLFIGRNYTALSSTNRTAQVLTTNNCKLRTAQSTSNAEIGFASAVGGITAGTIVEDATPIAQVARNPQTHAVTAAAAPGAAAQDANDHELIWTPAPMVGSPIVLAQNEGIRLRYLVTSAAAVVVTGRVSWAETGSTVYP